MDFASAKQGKRLFVKKRRRRTIISSKDLEKLEGLFKISKWPDRIQKGRLSKTIGKSENFISTWFQNRRARMRRLARQKDLLDDVDSSDSNVQSSENRCHKLHKYRTKSTNQRKDDFDETDSASREPVTVIVKQTKSVVEEIDESNSKDTFDGKNEYPGQENTPPAKGKPGGALCMSQGIGKAVVKMKKSPNDVIPSERRVLVETPICNSNDSTSWENVFRRIVDMMTACESVMSRSDTSFPFAVKDAALGIRLKDGKLYYSKDYGLDFEENE